MPYDMRPTSMPLDIEECRTAIWQADGNISRAASILKVNSSRLRSFVKSSPYLLREIEECDERMKDTAIDVVKDALNDTEDKARQDGMAKFVLGHIGQNRGFGKANQKEGVNLSMPKGTFKITWEDGTGFNDNEEPTTIEGEVVPNAGQ